MRCPRVLVPVLLLALAGCRPAPLPTAARRAAPRPSCPTPEQDLARRAGLDVNVPWGLRFVRERLDLDGDGVADLLLSTNAQCGSGGCDWHVYLRPGACARWQGRAFGRFEGTQPGPTRLRDLVVAPHSGACDAEEVVLRHDGRQYRPHASRRCRCVEIQGDRAPRPGEGCTPWRPVRQPPAGPPGRRPRSSRSMAARIAS
jgi:hypothetical protein